MQMVAQKHFTSNPEDNLDHWNELSAQLELAMVHREQAGKAHNDAENAYFEAVRSIEKVKPIEPEAEPLNLDLTVRELIKRSAYHPRQEAHEQAMREWRAKKDDLWTRIVGNLEERWEAALEATNCIQSEIAAYPVTSAEMLDQKLKALLIDGGFDCFRDEWFPHIVEDVERLSKPAR